MLADAPPKRTSMSPLDKTLSILREDAIQRGMSDLAIAYGWSQIRERERVLQRQMTELERYQMAKPKRQ